MNKLEEVFAMRTIAPAITTLLLLPAASVCAPVQWAVNGHYYEAGPAISTWNNALFDAQQSFHLGVQGHLVTFQSADEQAFVENLVQLPANAQLYIGLRLRPGGSLSNASDYEWVDGVASSYNNWGPGQPSSIFSDATAGSLYFSSNLAWQWRNVSPNFGPSQYVIEYDVSPSAVPEPTTAGTVLLALALLRASRGLSSKRCSTD